jgi:putative addiction module killer protein
MKDRIDILIYETDNGKCPYLQWESKLSSKDRGVISSRLSRIRLGNFGDCKSVKGKGLYELRIHYGPGYRIYFGKQNNQVILLLLGGDKKSQKKDIQKSYQFWQDYLESQKGK